MKCRATLDGPDGWSSGWLVDGHHVPTRLRCQQGGGGVMFWAGIMGRELVGPFRVTEGVKMTSEKYVEFLTDHFLPWYKEKNRAFRNKIIFMHGNAPSQAARNTSASLAAMGIKGEKLMVLPWEGFIPMPLSKNHQSSLVSRPQPLRNILVLLFPGPEHASEHAAGARGQLPVGAAAREPPVNYYTACHRPTDGGHSAGQLRTTVPPSEPTAQRPFGAKTPPSSSLTSTKINMKSEMRKPEKPYPFDTLAVKTDISHPISAEPPDVCPRGPKGDLEDGSRTSEWRCHVAVEGEMGLGGEVRDGQREEKVALGEEARPQRDVKSQQTALRRASSPFDTEAPL
ncbi:hypothetical protein L3Q82_001247 [Scortum barcoo]|uniref:Uncharacterized protein n=1 Tax=Scortum barcoo TaxID=214431 RepID=A0ACB8W7A5_9TELE|nr:hypothetical protein L3Q82_001247 [Scortum barcoo]